jgi:GNAT superfamily N-acetyltransferase
MNQPRVPAGSPEGGQFASMGKISVKEYSHGGASISMTHPEAKGIVTEMGEDDKPYERLKDGEAGRLLLGDKVLGRYLLVEDIFLRESARGKGVGKTLYKAAIDFAKSKGLKGIASGGSESRRNIVTDQIWKNHRSSRIGNYDVMEHWRGDTSIGWTPAKDASR